jgi:predicted ATPase
LSNRLLALAKRQENSALLLEAHHSAWATHFLTGEPSRARSHCEEGRRLYDVDRHRSLAALYGGHDPGVCARQHGALSEWLLGYPDSAVASVDESMRLAERLAQPLSVNHSSFYEAVVHLLRGEADTALRFVREAEAFARDQRLAPYLDPDILSAGILLAQRAVSDALAVIDRSAATRALFGLSWRPYHLAAVAETLRCAGDHNGAATALAEAEAAIEAKGERWWEAEIHRLDGLLLLARRHVAESERAFEQSLRIAREQQAKSLELRAATSLARLWGEQGRREEARALLAPIYGWFTEGFDTTDLKGAKALLAELA